ncbi:MAG: P1 family peptidase [Chloroflexota bacterium]|nr:P1 family peptidase [Chloroflexota bacterium]
MRTGANVDSITDVPGIEVGHAQDVVGQTGCTVVMCREGGVVGVDVRGCAPGTRETDLCRPGTLVDRAHAVLLAGGSAFGLNAAEGVMRYLAERGIGYDTGVARIPIVPAAVLFDLAVGRPVWPDGEMGYVACRTAGSEPAPTGPVGAGTGATVGKALGMAAAARSGLGSASISAAGAQVGALMVVNAFGQVVAPDTGEILAGPRGPDGRYVDTVQYLLSSTARPMPGVNTTIGVVATDARLDSAQVNHLATVAHDGLARVIRPVHTMLDGDTIFALATGGVDGGWSDTMLALEAAVVSVVERAIVRAVSVA